MTPEFGQCPTFNPEDFIKVAQQLVDADEVERALWLLNNVPAFYREHQVKEILEFKNSILARMVTPAGYVNDAHDCEIVDEQKASIVIDGTLRGTLIQRELAQGQFHVVDVGPGEYWLPVGVKGDFTYQAIGLDQKTRKAASMNPIIQSKLSEKQNGRTGVFVALEVIEHLSDTTDLMKECSKHFEEEPGYIHLSTPCYTYDASPKQGAKYLPHLRAYTPNEFLIEAHKLWPHYEWQVYLNPIMSLRGVHPRESRRARLI